MKTLKLTLVCIALGSGFLNAASKIQWMEAIEIKQVRQKSEKKCPLGQRDQTYRLDFKKFEELRAMECTRDTIFEAINDLLIQAGINKVPQDLVREYILWQLSEKSIDLSTVHRCPNCKKQDLRNYRCRSYLHVACMYLYNGQIHRYVQGGALAHVLLASEAGQHIDMPDCNGNRPLHYAARYKAPNKDVVRSVYEFAKVLIRSRADLLAVNAQGETPYLCAERAGNKELAGLFLYAEQVQRMQAAERQAQMGGLS